MRLTGTFIDEISHDIPHQNWGEKEWDRDFRAMKAIGIQRVIMIRCGYKRWMTYPSKVLEQYENGFTPPVDLVELFLRLADKYEMEFFFGTYDSGRPWYDNPDYDVQKESDLMRRIVDEAWLRYGHHKSFRGWYFSQEIARRNPFALDCYRHLGAHCKSLSPDLRIMISPGMLGPKAYDKDMKKVTRPITAAEHEAEWDENMDAIRDFIDIIAFQDGHLDFGQLPEFLAINKKLCDRYGIECWSNCESFDRDMPIDFLPIKWEKLLLKMNAASQAGVTEFISFEFSHFMSPNSCYFQAHGLYDRYCEHFGITVPDRESFGPR